MKGTRNNACLYIALGLRSRPRTQTHEDAARNGRVRDEEAGRRKMRQMRTRRRKRKIMARMRDKDAGDTKENMWVLNY